MAMYSISRHAIWAIIHDCRNETLQNQKIKEMKSKYWLKSIEEERERYGDFETKFIRVCNAKYDIFLRIEAVFHNISTREAHYRLKSNMIFTDDV